MFMCGQICGKKFASRTLETQILSKNNEKEEEREVKEEGKNEALRM